MSNFPIEIMVKLTYNICGGDNMAEFCYECLKKIYKTDKGINEYVVSRELNLCEECGRWKHTVVMERKAYYKYKFRFLMLPFEIIYRILCKLKTK